MNSPAELLAQDLQSVLERTFRLEAVLEDPRHQLGPLAVCFHGLQHFLADEDIRARDEGYRQMQENEMRKLIRLLRTGADDAALRRITFLGATTLAVSAGLVSSGDPKLIKLCDTIRISSGIYLAVFAAMVAAMLWSFSSVS